jgi:hypothetical protein
MLDILSFINEVNNFFFPDDTEIPKLSEEAMLNCEGIISKDECVSAIRTCFGISVSSGKKKLLTSLMLS